MRRVLAWAAGMLLTVAGANMAKGQVAAAPASQPGQTNVPVKMVVLFSSGVGYFEHIGNVTGNASTELRFKTAQINDILKSLVLQDLGQGTVSSVVYPSQDPLAKTLKSFQIDITNNPGLAELLNQIRGAKVKLVAGTETLNGTILGLEKKPKAVEKGQIEVWQMNVIAGGAIRSLPLDEVSKIELEDPGLQEELNKALAALVQARDQDKKPVTIHFKGQGERPVRLAYVVETPVWKTSYRLLMGEKPSLQGWAIIENQTDNDWNDVRLTLVSGRPISFVQELYQPLYIPRPVVQPELYASLRPQTYDAGMQMERLARAATPPPAAAPMAGGRGGFGGMGGAGGRMRVANGPVAADAVEMDEARRLAEKPMDAAASVASVAAAGKIGELFQYQVSSVSLPRQRSSMIPIITDPVEVQTLSIYNAGVLPRNPLNGARVRNTTQKHLLQGPVTVFQDGSYAGDARIDNVPPGQERLISYGIDLQMLVNATKNRQESSITSGKIVKGVLFLNRKHVFSQDYVAENKHDKDRTLIVEHPFRQGWKLTPDAPKPIETTEALYRFSESVPAGKSATLTVKEEMTQTEQQQILPMDISALEFYSKSGEISPKVKDALAKAAALKGRMTDAQRQLTQTKSEIERITREEERVRENIKVATANSPLKNSALAKLEQQEKQIDTLNKKADDQQTAFEAARAELEKYLTNLDVTD